jgi:hypothetical protein
MNTPEPAFINKVALSGIVTINLEDYLPTEDFKQLDMVEFLFMRMILKEKEYRAQLTTTTWSDYTNCHVSVVCSADAIIPSWAYMLLSECLRPYAKTVYLGTQAQHLQHLIRNQIMQIDPQQYTDQRVVIKGCGDKHVPVDAYIAISEMLLPVVKSLMYGEPCSTVPIYKKKKTEM